MNTLSSHFLLNIDRQPIQATDPTALRTQCLNAPGQAISSAWLAMAGRQTVNTTEHRTATHWAYRLAANPAIAQQLPHGGLEEETQALAAQRTLAQAAQTGQLNNPEGQPYQAIVHLGIGGSDLGPRLLNDVFSRLQLPSIYTLRFAANVDFHELQWALRGLNPKTTLVLIASKSFSTRETLLNANHVVQWLTAGAGKAYAQAALIAATSNPKKAHEFGIHPDRIFAFPDSVGGRFSVWGPVSLSLRMAYGNQVLDDFLAGGTHVDHHALTTPLPDNLPALLALTDRDRLQRGIQSLMVCAYDSRLGLLVPYLQQLWMESLGKGVSTRGEVLSAPPCPLLWGGTGTNNQHAFFQMLHQAPIACGIELVGIANPNHTQTSHHQALLSHFLAQAQAFATGQYNTESERLNPAINAKTCPGGRPVTSLLIAQLSPFTLGGLLALWEYRTTALAALQSINPFDQFGVELGKTIAGNLEQVLATTAKAHPEANHGTPASDTLNPTTARLIDGLQSMQQQVP
ncbi:MAG: glucose-6-phosphate isomerase [Limnobacter sp.]|nr:glucose-6-phosphate isomerase [Limnobacter sp.]